MCEKNYLKNYICLLKLSSLVKSKKPKFEDLVEMLKSPDQTKKHLVLLDAYAKGLESALDEIKVENSREFRTLEDKYDLVISTVNWFKVNIIPAVDNSEKQEYKEVNIQLVEALDKIAKDQEFHRSLFKDGDEVSIRNAVRDGKILLLNTNKWALGASSSKALENIWLSELRSAVLSKKNPHFTVFVDRASL